MFKPTPILFILQIQSIHTIILKPSPQHLPKKHARFSSGESPSLWGTLLASKTHLPSGKIVVCGFALALALCFALYFCPVIFALALYFALLLEFI